MCLIYNLSCISLYFVQKLSVAKYIIVFPKNQKTNHRIEILKTTFLWKMSVFIMFTRGDLQLFPPGKLKLDKCISGFLAALCVYRLLSP